MAGALKFPARRHRNSVNESHGEIKMGRRYAKGTSVEVDSSRGDIQSTIARFDCHFDGFVDERFRSIVCFRGYGRWVRFVVPIKANIDDQRKRELWRGVLAGIKGRLVNVKDGVEAFEEAFYAHLVTETGKRVFEEEAKPKLKGLPSPDLTDVESSR
jgi:hypothetical protein